jgi:nitrite reductase (cytochrome c-552)
LAEKIVERKGKGKTMSELNKKSGSVRIFVGIIVIVAIAAVAVTALLVNIFERKSEALNPYVRLVEVTEDDTDPTKWGKNWPKQYDSYKRTILTTSTRFGGHGGSETLPEEKIERDPNSA